MNAGVYVMTIEFPKKFPIKAPRVKLLTSAYHCNISGGRMYIDCLFKANWKPDWSMAKVMDQLDIVLLNPIPRNALDSTVAAFYM